MAVLHNRASFSELTRQPSEAHALTVIASRVLEGVDAVLDLAVSTLFAWQRRIADRLALQALDDHMLRDIGLSRADIEGEASKPFWKA